MVYSGKPQSKFDDHWGYSHDGMDTSIWAHLASVKHTQSDGTQNFSRGHLTIPMAMLLCKKKMLWLIWETHKPPSWEWLIAVPSTMKTVILGIVYCITGLTTLDICCHQTMACFCLSLRMYVYMIIYTYMYIPYTWQFWNINTWGGDQPHDFLTMSHCAMSYFGVNKRAPECIDPNMPCYFIGAINTSLFGGEEVVSSNNSTQLWRIIMIHR